MSHLVGSHKDRFSHDVDHIVTTSGILLAILERGPRAFQIGKISAVNHLGNFLNKQ